MTQRLRIACLAWLCTALLSGCSPNPEEMSHEGLAALVERAELGGVEESDLTQASAELQRRMADHPDDVRTIILAARLGIIDDWLRPTVIHKGEEPPTAESIKDEPRAVHALLDRALVLEPGNAEAHYWKARVFGTEAGIVREGRVYREPRNLAGAVDHARRAVELDAGQASYREALALYLVADGRLVEATAAVRDMPGAPRPIPRLLADLGAFPLPKGSVFLAEDSASFRVQQLERGRISDYPQLRVFYYVVPQSAADLEEFFRTHWQDFHLFSVGDPALEAGVQSSVFMETFAWEAETLRPAASEEEFRDVAETGGAVIGFNLSVVEIRDPNAVHRKQSPASAHLPADLGDVFCYLILVNGRRIEGR